MKNYIDKYGRYHDKPVPSSEEPSSNNGWIYTAYAAKAGLELDKQKLAECFHDCQIYDFVNGVQYFIRSPGKKLPPNSRDEILGAVALGLLKPVHLEEQRHIPEWNFSPYPLPRFNLFKLLSQLKEAYGKHRNYFWQNNLDQLYRFAFSVPLQDRHFILKKWNKFKFYNPVHLFYAVYGKASSMISPGALDWLKYDEKRGLEGIKKEFPEDHPIRQKLEL